MRTQYYPNALVESDYHKLKKGDIVTMGGSGAIYLIEDISRTMMTPEQLDKWVGCITRKVSSYSPNSAHTVSATQILDTKLHDLLEGYKNTGNFGVCSFNLKPIFRGTSEVAKGRSKTILEPDTTNQVSYRCLLNKVDLTSEINNRQWLANREEDKITVSMLKRDKFKLAAINLKNLRDKLNGTKATTTVLVAGGGVLIGKSGN